MTKEAVPAAKLRVAAVTPFTTIDFPGKLSAVVFVQGCPWRCPYCHNPWMQPREFAPDLEHGSWQGVEHLLKRRKGLLDGVVFSGGEPTIDPALPAAVERVRELGYLAALHTGGAYPAHFAEVAGRLSWVGLDVKASPDLPDAFDRAAGRVGACAKFLETYRTLREAGIEYECRTTVHPTLHDEAGLMRLADWLEAEEVEHFALQIYRAPKGLLLSKLLARVDADYPGDAVLERFRQAVPHFTLRRES